MHSKNMIFIKDQELQSDNENPILQIQVQKVKELHNDNENSEYYAQQREEKDYQRWLKNRQQN